MDKSLSPLIIFISAIVLTTVVMLTVPNAPKSNLPDTVESPNDRRQPIVRIDILNIEPFWPRGETSAKPFQITQTPDLNYLMREALASFDDKKSSEAEDKLKTIIMFDPSNFQAFGMLGKIFYDRGRYNEAEMIFKRQEKIRTDDPSVYINMGAALTKQGKYDDAINANLKAINLDSDSVVPLIALAGLYSLKEEDENAINYLKKAYVAVGSERIATIAADPVFDNIRDEPEFQKIIKGIVYSPQKMSEDMQDSDQNIQKENQGKTQVP